MAPSLVVRDDDEAPARVGSYVVPLLLIVLACAGYVYWRRAQRGNTAFSLDRLPSLGQLQNLANPGVRLSMEGNGPPAEVFISNNASTDSLPLHAAPDIPVLPQPDRFVDTPSPARSRSPAQHPARSDSLTPLVEGADPLGAGVVGDTGTVSKKETRGFGLGRGRRSQRARGPVEDSESEDVFGIGDDDDEL
ncbi:OTU protein [Cryptotrichosporon argae]